jgi:hypothetical protein
MPDLPTSRRAAFQHTPPQPLATLYPYRTPAWRNAVARPCSAIEHQGIERPVGIGVHLNSAVPADQNRHFLAAFPAIERFQGGIHQALGLFGELHLVLIAISGISFKFIGWYPGSSDRLQCFPAGYFCKAGRVYSARPGSAVDPRLPLSRRTWFANPP